MAKHSPFRNHIEAAFTKVLIATLQHTPLPVANWLGGKYAGLLDLAIPRLRRFARINLSFAYPDRDAVWREQTIDGIFRSIGRILTAVARFPRIHKGNVQNLVRYEGFEHYVTAKERGKGVLFATAHLGNWELSAYAHALLTEPMHVVVRPFDNPILDALVEHRRGMSGNNLLSRRDFARQILQALKKNEPVGILMDQNTIPENGAFVNFFGKPACTNTTFARIAARSGAAVIPGFLLWSEAERRYVLKFYPIVEMSGDAIEDTARIQKAIETAVREAPDQWLWIHRRWKNRPAGEPGLY